MTTLKILDLDLTDRDTAIDYIKAHLEKRTGIKWSVRGGKGTAWGWITINALPKNCTWHHVKMDAPVGDKEYELRNTGEKNGYMGPELQATLAKALGIESVHYQGVSIPASGNHRIEYCQRAAGEEVSVIGEQYWD